MNSLSCRRRIGPDFVCVGPQRTASSWLDQQLRAHPEVVLPENVKETFFFDRYFERGMDWYASLFSHGELGRILGEVGSTYFESSSAKERIYRLNHEARIIIMVRNPIARTFSSFRHEVAKGRSQAEFFEALTQQPRIIESGRYANLAPQWEAAFGNQRTFYLVQDDVESDPEGALEDLFKFLQIEPIQLCDEARKRHGAGTVPAYPRLAAVAAHTASVLRGMGFHRFVEAGKALGLKRVYSGGDPGALTMTRSIFDYLISQHHADIEFLEKRLGRQFPCWWRPESYGVEV